MVSMEEYEVDTEVDEINLRSSRSIPFAGKAQQNGEVVSSKAEKKSKAKKIKASTSEKTTAGDVSPSSSKAKDPKPDTGRLWLHAYGVVSSTLHQCIKYLVNGEVKSVSVDMDLFRGEKVSYSDAKFYGPPGISFTQPSKVDKEKGVTVKAGKSQKVEVSKPSKVIRVKLTPRGASSSKVEEVLTAKGPKPKINIKISNKIAW
ncbi:hypothetical protein L3X38_003976 [Prunus dulcis]|uniref:Uncharacterized protein n=1 Tax=Prunus dulcis TaxID=3755 RepID=A0AAD4ZN06_PRUDU|nr:hypothetical protein L3X38_003976 [Prunus dulcis]